MFKTLIAFLQGRRGVLDDCGQLIETRSDITGNLLDLEDEFDDEESEQAETADPVDTHMTFTTVVRRSTGTLFGCVMVLFFISWTIHACWLVSGWVGRSLLSVPGPIGNIVGSVSVIAVLVALAAGAHRFDQARKYRRASNGESDEADRRMKFLSLIRHNRCPACMYEIDESSADACGKVRCAECGACWIPHRWVGYLNLERDGVYADLKKNKQRRACCLLDARGQIFRVLMDLDHNALSDRIRTVTPEPLWTERIKLLFMIIGILVLLITVIGISTLINSGFVGLVFGAVSVSVLLMLPFIFIRNYRRRFRDRLLQQLARDLIDIGCCASCTGALDTHPHPIDAFRCCPGCGLAFDTNTLDRRHHTRRRIPDERIGSDPVFFSRSTQ